MTTYAGQKHCPRILEDHGLEDSGRGRSIPADDPKARMHEDKPTKREYRIDKLNAEKIARLTQSAIHNVLIEEWDPIGVNGFPEAQDEYDSYIPSLCKMLLSCQLMHEIFDYLWGLETEHMGLVGDRVKTKMIAERLVDVFEQIRNQN